MVPVVCVAAGMETDGTAAVAELNWGAAGAVASADSDDVFLTVLTTVRADGTDGAALSTVVEAKARPVTYNQAYSNCSSKGGIERRIAELVNAKLAR